MRVGGRTVFALAAFVVLAALLPAPGLAQEDSPENCPYGTNPDLSIGPICAELVTPNTNYHLLDVPDQYEIDPESQSRVFTRVMWGRTNVTCGQFLPNNGAPSGTHEEDLDEFAQWNHLACAHETSDQRDDHPGTIVAVPMTMVEWYLSLGNDAAPAPPIPLTGELPPLCTKEGAASGIGPACGDLPPDAFCLTDTTQAAVVQQSSGDIKLSASNTTVKAELEADADDGEPVLRECEVIRDDVENLVVAEVDPTPDSGAQPPTFTIHRSWLAHTGIPTLGLASLNGATLEVEGTGGRDSILISGLAPVGSVPAGFALDINGDGTYDIGARNFGGLDLDLGRGDDRIILRDGIEHLTAGLDRPLEINGGAGRDTFTSYLFAASANHSTLAFGTAYDGNQRKTYVNFNPDDGLDEAYVQLAEKLGFFGTNGNDVISGAGIAGIGKPVVIPVVLSGGDGNDKLTGGAKADTFKGGAGKDTCNGGAGDDKATGCETLRRM